MSPPSIADPTIAACNAKHPVACEIAIVYPGAHEQLTVIGNLLLQATPMTVFEVRRKSSFVVRPAARADPQVRTVPSLLQLWTPQTLQGADNSVQGDWSADGEEMVSTLVAKLL